MTTRPFLDFYEKLKFAPTETLELEKRRNLKILKDLLYNDLGVPAITLKGLDILEIGPGSGENIERILEHDPKFLTILDGSKSVLQNIKKKIDFNKTEHDLILADVREFSSEKKYDLVIAEGIIPLQYEPAKIFKNISNLLTSNGILIVTTFDEFSGFSEVCRRFLAKKIFTDLNYSPELLKKITNFFLEDFRSLPGMTRDPAHWVLDSIFNPWAGELFSVNDAIEARKQELLFVSSSPKFFQDFRWYKNLDKLDTEKNNNFVVDFYSRSCINFFDQRYIVKPIDIHAYSALSKLLKKFFYQVRAEVLNQDNYSVEEFNTFLSEILEFEELFHFGTTQSLKSLLLWTESNEVDHLAEFRKLWGRGQQYVSFVRKV
jgi:2-polyprenyl-3-methyl-5-hydroxy-6-metoxy-1,4-benzoquinol methylase